MNFPLQRRALRSALAATGAVAVASGLGGAVRLLPWLLDPAVTFRLALPFARGLLALACEAAILVGWPIGWSLATASLVERGEARVLATLGESPRRTLARLAPHAAAFACALGLVSFLGGREASEPGRVVTDLVERGRETCADVTEVATYSVPFAGVTWLCAPGVTPRLVGRGPSGFAGAIFTARGARAQGDLREIELEDARVLLGAVRVHAGSLRLGGLSPFAHASSVPPLARALALTAAGAVAASWSVFALLTGHIRGRMAAIVLAASGPLTALGVMRAVDRMDGSWPGPWAASLAIPILTFSAVLTTTAVLSRLPRGVRAASKR
jgi:hypothetical protein